jgi:prepilin-type N-terminal cleavage/methylation domain-containing protein
MASTVQHSSRTMTRRDSGFTLIEVLIVTAVIGVIAGIAVPNLLTSRTVANERAVIATLRTISTAQAQCWSQRVVDVDGDGCGEAMSLAEMAGSIGLRNGPMKLWPATLPTSLGMISPSGYTTAKGYQLAVYLPDGAGQGLLAIPANLASVNADLAETAWTCVAWPLTRGGTGNATFFVNQAGEILVARQATYSGGTSVPPCGAALVGVPSNVIIGGDLAADTIGADGNRWSTLR